MLAIKKVAVTPLPESEGKIIDSFDTTDDQTKNAPSARATKEYIEEYASSQVEEYVNNKVLSGTGAPSSVLGKDGDIYIQYS